MRVAIIENTAITHHGQVGVALHEAAARIDLWKPWRDGALPEAGAYDALVVFGAVRAANCAWRPAFVRGAAGGAAPVDSVAALISRFAS